MLNYYERFQIQYYKFINLCFELKAKLALVLVFEQKIFVFKKGPLSIAVILVRFHAFFSIFVFKKSNPIFLMPHLARQKKNALYLSLENDLFKVVFKKKNLWKPVKAVQILKRMDSFLLTMLQFSFFHNH